MIPAKHPGATTTSPAHPHHVTISPPPCPSPDSLPPSQPSPPNLYITPSPYHLTSSPHHISTCCIVLYCITTVSPPLPLPLPPPPPFHESPEHVQIRTHNQTNNTTQPKSLHPNTYHEHSPKFIIPGISNIQPLSFPPLFSLLCFSILYL